MTHKFMTRFALMAGVLAVTATAALAQNVKGTIPFAFSISGTALPAGTYELHRMQAVTPVWVLRNVATKQMALAVGAYSAASRPLAEADTASLKFRCAGDQCALAALYGPASTTGQGFRVAKPRDPKVEIALVSIPLSD